MTAIKETVLASEYELYACYRNGENGGTIFVLLDDAKGLCVKDCMKVSNLIDTDLENAGIDRNHLNIEVSSPGIDRPLVEPPHFQAAIGETVKIKLIQAVDESLQKSFTCKLLGADDKEIIFEDKKNYQYHATYDNISKAFLVYTKRRGTK